VIGSGSKEWIEVIKEKLVLKEGFPDGVHATRALWSSVTKRGVGGRGQEENEGEGRVMAV